MTLQEFTPIFELSVALNIAYASIPQLGKAIQQISFSSVNKQTKNLIDKTASAKNKLGAIPEERLAEEGNQVLQDRLTRERSQSRKIVRDIKKDGIKGNIDVSKRMSIFFIASSIFSLWILYIAGVSVTTDDNIPKFPLIEIFNAYVTIISILVLSMLVKHFNGDVFKKSVIGFISIVIIVLFIVCNKYSTEIYIALNSLKYLNILYINIILITMLLPLVITIPQYYWLANQISKKHKTTIDKQTDDIKELLEAIEKVATSQESERLLKKFAEEEKK